MSWGHKHIEYHNTTNNRYFIWLILHISSSAPSQCLYLHQAHTVHAWCEAHCVRLGASSCEITASFSVQLKLRPHRVEMSLLGVKVLTVCLVAPSVVTGDSPERERWDVSQSPSLSFSSGGTWRWPWGRPWTPHQDTWDTGTLVSSETVLVCTTLWSRHLHTSQSLLKL